MGINNISDQINDKKLSLIRIIIFGISLVLVLVGCSNKHAEWQNHNKSKEFWYGDILKCKNFSEAKLTRQLDLENDAYFNNKTDLQMQFEKYDAVKKFNFYYADCMTNSGYYKILKIIK
jgi:hypothetical protein